MIEGKIANQSPSRTIRGEVKCSKCSKLVDIPEYGALKIEKDSKEEHLIVYSYLHKQQFIYETRKGRAVVYCSKYCRDKHNHRFQK